jgi:hypothetical protein
MSFRSVFVALTIAFALILGAFLIQRARPRIETDQPNADFVKATGKCAECHSRQQYSIVHEYEMSKHVSTASIVTSRKKGRSQIARTINGFVITARITPANCRSTRNLRAAAMPRLPGLPSMVKRA